MIDLNSVELKGEISLLILATESRGKILKAISKTLNIPLDTIEEKSTRQMLTGYFGYPIEHFKFPLRGGRCEEVIRTIINELPATDRNFLLENIDDFTDKRGNLYIRLDKQEACLGRLKLSDNDPVRIMIKGGRRELEKFIEGDKNV